MASQSSEDGGMDNFAGSSSQLSLLGKFVPKKKSRELSKGQSLGSHTSGNSPIPVKDEKPNDPPRNDPPRPGKKRFLSTAANILLKSTHGHKDWTNKAKLVACYADKHSRLVKKPYMGVTSEAPLGLVIGRNQLNDERISRKHCNIYYSETHQCWVLADHSTNGCLVNDKPVHRRSEHLKHGDIIYFGVNAPSPNVNPEDYPFAFILHVRNDSDSESDSDEEQRAKKQKLQKQPTKYETEEDRKPIVKARDVLREMAAEYTCPICLDMLDQPRTLVCGHLFCNACITPWRSYNNHVECPSCRTLSHTVNGAPAAAAFVERFKKFDESEEKG